MIKDYLMSFDNAIPLGIYAEKAAAEYEIDRSIQDDYSVLSYQRAL